jgi:hypothetical protein
MYQLLPLVVFASTHLTRRDLTLTWPTCQPDNKTTSANPATTSLVLLLPQQHPPIFSSINLHQHQPHYLAESSVLLSNRFVN